MNETEITTYLNHYLRLYHEYRKLIRNVTHGMITASIVVVLMFVCACYVPSLSAKLVCTSISIFTIWHISTGFDLLRKIKKERQDIHNMIERFTMMLHQLKCDEKNL